MMSASVFELKTFLSIKLEVRTAIVALTNKTELGGWRCCKSGNHPVIAGR
jgi:hypothetical protein